MEPTSYIWSDGEMVEWEAATVHFLSHALHYGTGVFEGIRAYATPEGTAVFRLTDHMERLHRSARAYGLPLRHDVATLNEACRELLRVNELESGYVRPLVFFAEGAASVNPKGASVRTMMAAWAWGPYMGEDGIRDGVRARVSSWRRISPSSFIPTAKGTGQYLNSVLAKSEATRTGYDEAILLNEQGSVAEASGANIFVARDGGVVTPPVSSGILEGITRASVMKLLTDAGIEVKESVLMRGSLYDADELFFVGTAAEVTPIRELDDRPIGSGVPGPITRMAQDLFADAVRGKLDEYRHWLDLV